MSLFVYITEKCKENAERYALSDELDRFKERVERSQSRSQFDPFPPPYLVKKKLGGRQGRLIADLRNQGDHAVIVFLAIMIRGDRAYEDQFSKNPISYGEQHFANLVSNDELASYINERTSVAPPPTKASPSDQEFGFLYEAFAHRQCAVDEDMVYETIEWKDAVAEDRIANHLVRFAQPCFDALSREPGIHFIEVPGKAGWGLWVHRSEKRLLLIIPSTELTDKKASKTVEMYRSKLDGDSLSHIIRSSRRAYPAYMLVDEDTWVEIEKEPVANMALSPEESEVLLSARQSDGSFPLFVNGRAGSGKSTILQYLFADILHYYLNNQAVQVVAPPVYLTANGELLRAARAFIERILRNEAAFRGGGLGNLVEENREIIDEAFREFQPYLLSMIEPTARVERFALSRRIDYSLFRKLWKEWFGMDRNANREFGPDVSWHVIRSYIKGMQSETHMDPDDYVQLPENQITVTRNTFQTVFERVWEGRYAKICDAKKLWDDQDLARYILENELAKPVHPAVLCDEAQDFTRIELELLLRLNLFSDRAVPPHDLSRIPFAFAGDQFQTLNPTGFRWDAIKASFVEKFIYALDPSGRSGRTELNYRELHYNYRSTPSIVRFSNGVQALRAALFQMPELRPQTPWSLSSGVFPVVWFNSADPSFWKKFKEADSFVVIVPCGEGEEAQYVQDDPVLRQHIRVEDGIPQNVLSAARAKGREYQVVVVYGFGSVAPGGDIMETLDAVSQHSLNQDNSLPLQYFINRLYVAVSRPKQRLIVVDDESGIKRLWEFAIREEASKQIVEAANRGRNIWNTDPEDSSSPAVEGMSMGKAEDLNRESAGDPIDNAKTFEEDGRARKDAFLLRQSALAYRRAGDLAKAIECRARALELEGNYLDSAQAYVESGFLVPEAVRCYWKAGSEGWKKLIELGKTSAQVARETEFKFAIAIRERNISLNNEVDLLDELATRLSDSNFAFYVAAEKAWRDGIDDIADNVRQNAQVIVLLSLEKALERIESAGIALSDKRMAEIYFQTKSLQKAVHRWEKSGETKSESYLKAKAAISPYPERLSALLKVNAVDEIISTYENNKDITLDRGQWSVVASAYLQCERIDEAFDAAWEGSDSELMQRIALKALTKRDTVAAKRALIGSFYALVENAQWEPLAKFASTLDYSSDPGSSEDAVRELIEAHTDEFQCELVRALARSEKITDLQVHLQRQFSEFLRRFLRVKEGKWRSVLSVDEAGAAIERAGRFTDALSFYEAVMRETNFSEEEKLFGRRRWLVSKTRQLNYERDPSGKQSGRTIDVQKEISEGMSLLGIKRIGDLPKYPALLPIAKPVKAQPTVPEVQISEPESPIAGDRTPEPIRQTVPESRTDWPVRLSAKIGEFSIEISRQLGRCNFVHGSSMQAAFVNLQTLEAGGEMEWSMVLPNEWFCSEWGLRVKYSNNVLVVTKDDLGLQLTIQSPSISK